MSDNKPIRRALISVFHKDGLDDILRMLVEDGVQLVSTGGTRQYIMSQGYACTDVEELTGYPSIFGGRVKTLHPAVFGGILMRRDNDDDRRQASEYKIEPIDLVIVDLYPFVETVKAGGDEQEIIEKIDIGGISLIRAAAKNYADTVIVASKAQYGELADILRSQGASTTLEQRRRLAREAFAVSSGYDAAIYGYFAAEEAQPDALRIAVDGVRHLRYGENPHQKGRYCGHLEEVFEQLHGKELSYNNLVDIDAALALIAEFDAPTVAILKHTNACGCASRDTIGEAWRTALACDPVSAFGGVIVANRPIDADTAADMNKIFSEVVIAPDYSEEALQTLSSKKNRILLRLTPDALHIVRRGPSAKTVLGGMLVQDRDSVADTETDMRCVTKKDIDSSKMADLVFANILVKHSKSNAIVLARDRQLCASGVGQTSRVDALRQAIDKARAFGHSLDGAVMASDAFFPFADCVEIAHKAGVDTVVHPGGSIRDQESVDYCDANGMAMAMTGHRHFRH